MPTMIEFATPAGPDFIALCAIDRVCPAPDVMTPPGSVAALVYIRGQCGPILVHGDARAIAGELELLWGGGLTLAGAEPPVRIPAPAPAIERPAEPARPTLYQEARARLQASRAEVLRLQAEQAGQSGRAEQL